VDKYKQLVEILRTNIDSKHVGYLNEALSYVEKFGMYDEFVNFVEKNMKSAPSYLDVVYAFCNDWDLF